VGGFVGVCSNDDDTDANKPLITNCFATGNVTGGSRNLGGFVGWCTGLISQSSATGNVHGTSTTETRIGGFVGGLAFYTDSTGKIDHCYARGNVTTDSENSLSIHGIGGFLGAFYYHAVVTDSYATGTVQNVGSNRGGFIGRVPSSYTDLRNSWDKESSGMTVNWGNATGRTTAELISYSQLIDAGWDFVEETENGEDDIWSINPSHNDGYPTLAWQGNELVYTLPATVTLSDLNPTYDGNAKSATVVTDPAGLTVIVTYDGSATAPTNAGTYAVVATVTDSLYEGSASGELVISKATPVIIVQPSASEINDGQSLADSTLTDGGANVAGSFAFTSPATIPDVGAASHEVTFTPTDTSNYNTATISVEVSVVSNTTPYADWIDRHDVGSSSDPNDNPDGDGYNNFLEYGFGMDPSVSDGNSSLEIHDGVITQNGPPQIYVEPTHNRVYLRYTRRTSHVADGLIYTAQFAADSLGVGAFVDVPSGKVVGTGTGAGGVEIEAVAVEFPDALPGSGRKARFGRIDLVEAP
jgi:hypothetical protein